MLSDLVEFLVGCLNMVMVSEEWEQRVGLYPLAAQILNVVAIETTDI